MQQSPFTNQNTPAHNVYVNPYGMQRLSPMFQPGTFDVLCARGKVAYNHMGNKRFRALVRQHRKAYSSAKCKYEKSKIVSFILSTVRNASPHGGFVKKIDGYWFEVGDRHAKEKVGQTFRDLLHTKYSSSTKAKARARMQRRIGQEDDGVSQKRPETIPSAIPSSHTARDEDNIPSSVSVVSSGSVDVESNATTVAKSNTGLPPLKTVIFKPEQSQSRLAHPGSVHLPHITPTHSQRNRFMESPRSNSIEPFPLAAPSTSTDLEPLPLGESVKVNLNESTSTIQSDESFEDAMSEFYKKMGVPV